MCLIILHCRILEMLGELEMDKRIILSLSRGSHYIIFVAAINTLLIDSYNSLMKRNFAILQAGAY
jgi:hypothetical protein